MTSERSTGQRELGHDVPTILRTVDRSAVVPEIDRQLGQRPGPRAKLPTRALFVGMMLSIHRESQGYQHERVTQVLRRLDEHWQLELGLPMRKVRRRERKTQGTTRKMQTTLTYDIVRHKFKSVMAVACDLYGDDLVDFKLKFLEPSLPDEVQQQRSVLVDGTFHPVWARPRTAKELDADPTTDVSHYIREGDGGKPKHLDEVGYLGLTFHAYDPTDAFPTPFVKYFEIATAKAGEAKVAATAVKQLVERDRILDLVVTDGAFGRDPDFHGAVHAAHGDVIFRPTHQQQLAVATHSSGDLLWNGRVFPPDVDLHRLQVNADGERCFPTRPPQAQNFKEPEARQTLDAWHEMFERIDRQARKQHSLPTLDRTFRVERRPTEIERLRGRDPSADDPATATVHAKDFPIRSWQVVPFGTPAWSHLHNPARSRNEGGMGDLRNIVGLEKGHKGMRLRGLITWNFVATLGHALRNLQLSKRLQPSYGRSEPPITKRTYFAPPADFKALKRLLDRRKRDRDQIEQRRERDPAYRRRRRPQPPERRLP